MKKNICYLCTIFVLFSTLAIPAKSEAMTGFLLGFALGSTSSSDNQAEGFLSNNVVYIMPDLEKKLPQKEFLNIKSISIKGSLRPSSWDNSSLSKKSIMEIFCMAAEESKIDYQKYKIIKVEKFFSPEDRTMVYIFTYIEKNKLRN